MNDWLIAFIAAAGLVGLIIWCARIFIWVMYG
jgi:hypothetical protein